MEDTLEQTTHTQNLVEYSQILWDQIIQVMEQFKTHPKIYQLCETMNIKNAELYIINHLSEIEKKIPYDKKIIEFINSLSNQELKNSRVIEKFDVLLKFINVIEKGEFLKALVTNIEKFHETILKFKRQFIKVKKLVLPSPWSIDPWL
jgi:hypothetical protein